MQWAKTNRNQKGFTIVELLVVIVVIAILAAITIVSYNGISERANMSLVQADLNMAAKQLHADKTTSSDEKYPATLALAAGGKGLKASSGAAFEYTADNLARPAGFCLSSSKGSSMYYIDQTAGVQQGFCPGHNGGGANIVNLATNPSIELNGSGFTLASYMGLSGSETATRSSTIAHTGGNSLRITGLNIPAGDDEAVRVIASYSPIVMVPNDRYQFSTYVRTSNSNVRVGVGGFYQFTRLTGGGNSVGVAEQPTSVAANTWTRRFAELPINSNALTIAASSNARVRMEISISAQTTAIVPSDIIYLDSMMITKANTLPAYADGNSPGWVWGGTPNNSVSRGPIVP